MLCAFAVSLKAQDANEGIQFVENKTFYETLMLARQQNKMVFVDCYTTWCGPCKMLSAKVFPQKVCGDFFNKEFVSIKIDMEKGEGIELKEKFNVTAFPTLLFFDSDGKEINRIVGASADAEQFVESVKAGLGANSLSAMRERFAAGERDRDFLFQYLDVVSRANDNKSAVEVLPLLLDGHEAEMLDKPRLFGAFLKYNTSPLTPAFQYLMAHRADFDAKVGKERLDRIVDNTWMSHPRTFVTKNADGTVNYDAAAMEAYKQEMEKWNVANREEIVLLSDINVAVNYQNWKDLAKLGTQYNKKFGAKDIYLYQWAKLINDKCTDKKVRRTAIKWLQQRQKQIAKDKKNEKPLPPGTIRAYSMANFSDNYPQLIYDLKK